MTWNDDNEVSQEAVTPSYPYQYWDFLYYSNHVALANPKNSSKNIYEFLRGDGSVNEIYQVTSVDSACVWDVEQYGSYYTFLNIRWNQYLCCTGGGALSLSDTITSGCQFSLAIISGTWLRISITVSSTTYYLQSSFDGHTVSAVTTYNSADYSYWWQYNHQVCYAPIESQVLPVQALVSNGDGTVSLTDSLATNCYWVYRARNGTNLYAYQSCNDDGYLIANDDDSTMGETTSETTPATPLGLGSNAIFNFTIVYPPEKKLPENPFVMKLEKLKKIGFNDNDKNIEALVKSKANIVEAIKILLTNLKSFKKIMQDSEK